MKVKNWEKWQSYRNDRGQPPWIKIHRRLMRNPDWVALTDSQRGQLVAIWMLAADHNGLISDEPEVIRKLCFMSSEPDLNLFIALGFLDARVTPIRRKLASTRRQHDAPDKSRVETDKKEKRSPKSELLSILDEQHADAVLEHRQKLRKPLSAYAAKLLACHFAECPDANAAADLMVERGWLIVKHDWLQDKARQNGAGYYVKVGSSQATAWQRYANKHNDGNLIYRFRGKADGEEVHVPSEWPPR